MAGVHMSTRMAACSSRASGSRSSLAYALGPILVPRPGSVARVTAVRRAGMLDESLPYAMDVDLFLRLQDVARVRYVPQILATFRWHVASTTVPDSAASETEARAIRVRTWTGRRSMGADVEPVALAAGRLLHRLQRGL